MLPIMKSPPDQATSMPGLWTQQWFSGWVHLLAGCLPALLPGHAGRAGEVALPLLEFVTPVNGAVYSTLDEVPIMLRASAPGDVFPGADVLANQSSIGTATFCCPLCP
jgi:hypothetical protein